MSNHSSEHLTTYRFKTHDKKLTSYILFISKYVKDIMM